MDTGDLKNRKDINIRALRFSLMVALGLVVAGPGVSDEIVTSEAVQSYVRVRAEPTTDSAMIGALRPGKSAPLIDETEEWFEIELSGGITGFVSRQWTRKTSLAGSPSGRRIYATDTPAPQAPAAPARDRRALARASKLLEQGRPQAAYESLAQLELEWGGDAGFDYLYGVAALDSGHAGEAIFSLERVIRSLPGFIGARMDLARALYETGDFERAEKEFQELLDAEPPEEVRVVIAGYLDALRQPQQDREKKPDRVFYAAASGGYDTNANGAADINSFLGFTLDPSSTEQDTPFFEAQLGGLASRPLTPGLDFLWRADVRHRHNPNADFVDHSFVNTNAALSFGGDKNNFLAGVAAYWSALDSSFNERSAALDLGWTRALRKNVMQLTLRAGPVEFRDAQKIRDIDRVLYTLTLRQPIQGESGVLDWTLIGGRDRAEDRTSAYSNTRVGARIGAILEAASTNLRFDVGYLNIPYNGNQDFFGIDREDEQLTSTFSIEIKDMPLRGWSFVPNLRYVKNNSNVAIFNYDRVEIGVSFRVAR